MDIKQIKSCASCGHMDTTHNCDVNNVTVNLFQTCESHEQKFQMNQNSSCSNCTYYKNKGCPNPNKSAEGMLCLAWKSIHQA